MGNQSQLESLSLHRNQLTGPVPFQLGNLERVDKLSTEPGNGVFNG